MGSLKEAFGLGFGEMVLIEPGKKHTFSTRVFTSVDEDTRPSPSGEFRGEKIVIAKEGASKAKVSGLVLVDVRVGGRSQFVSPPAGLPVEMFAHDFEGGVRFSMDLAFKGTLVEIEVENRSEEPWRVALALYGLGKRDGWVGQET